MMVSKNVFESNKSKSKLLLKKVSVDGYVCGDFLEFSLSQLYENRSEKSIDAIYTFPIPHTAVLTGFEAELGGRMLKAIVEEKEEASRLFEEAADNGINTFTLDQLDENIFQISIGNILPSETVKVKISYIDQLIYEDDVYELIIPSVEAAKFLEEESEDEMEAEEAYKLKMNLFVESMSKLDFSSPSHSINIERDDNNLSKITLKNKNESLDSDFILFLTEENQEEASGMSYNYQDEEGEKGILYLRILPKLEADSNEESEYYTFIMDISEATDDEKLEEAKNALQLCIRNLTEKDYFNIFAFSKDKICFSDNGKVPFNEENLKKATEWIDALTAQESPDVYEAVKHALEDQNENGYSTIIIFTDDEVEDEDKTLEYVRDNIGDNRIFPIGIDVSVNSYFINKLAQYGYGKAEFIYPDERIEDMVLRQFNRITNPQVDVIDIDWGKMNVEATYPRTIEYLYDREPFSIFAKVNGEISGEVTIKGKVGEEDYIKVINIDNLELEENGSLIQKVWSRKRIESIEERMRSERGPVAESMRKKIIEISKDSGIISTETTFVMLEQIEEPVLGMTLNRMIPIDVTEEVMKDISEGYFRDLPSYSKKAGIRETMAEERLDSDTAKHMLKYSKENMLSILARNQGADGSITNFDTKSKYDTIENTVVSLLSFALSREDISIYVDQLNKALQFTIKGLNDSEIEFDEKLEVLTLITLYIYNNRGIVRRKIKSELELSLELLTDRVKNKKYIAVENVLESRNMGNIRFFISMILGIAKEYALKDKEILNGDTKNSIDKISKLVLSKTL